MSALLIALLLSAQPADAPMDTSTGVPAQAVSILDVAIRECPLNRRPTEAQQERLEELLRIEAEEGVPPFVRGILLAAACHESAYKLRPGCGDNGASCGLFQFHSSHNERLRAMGAQGDDPRLDWRVAARYWLRHLKRQLPRVRRDCRGKGGYETRTEYLWASANKTATWKTKCGRWGRCREWRSGRCVRRYCASMAGRCSRPKYGWTTKHWARLRAWHGRG